MKLVVAAGVAFIIIVAVAVLLSTIWAGQDLPLPLPHGWKIPIWALCAVILACGGVIGVALGRWLGLNSLVYTVLTLSAIFFLGAAAAAEAALKFDPSVLRVTLLLFVGALAFEATRNEIETEPPRPSRRRRPLWLVGGAILAFAVPALLGDPTPARSGLAIGLGAGALAAAFAAARAMRKADGLEITSWAGGLGGGRASFRLSRAAGSFLLAVALAGAAAAIMSQRPAPRGSTEEKAVARPGEALKPPSGAADKKD